MNNDCPSTIHAASEDNPDPWPMQPATITGTFDPGPINGNPQQHMTYCFRCARALRMAGCFRPDDPEAFIKDVVE